MISIPSDLPTADPTRDVFRAAYRLDETEAVDRILGAAELSAEALDRIGSRARKLVESVRRQRIGKGGLEDFLHEYALSSKEGIVLMCLAEALLRIPDAETVDKLIRDKLADADWARHLGHSDSLLVNASTWALMLTGRMVRAETSGNPDLSSTLKRLLARSGEPVLRQAVTQAMRILGRQFVMGRTIGEALDRARSPEREGYRHSYDMLGEAARTADDASHYFDGYRQAIAALGKAARGRSIQEAPGISVKLSALHPRYEEAKRFRVSSELLPRLKTLAVEAKTAGIGFTVDAEESERLELSLDLIAHLAGDTDLIGWDGFGLAVQAYQKRAITLIDWLEELALKTGRRLMVRLVKGAYWDSEIKRTQERGLRGYPVFTRKMATDVSYIACTKRLLANAQAFFPQFATHNAHTVATVLELAGGRRDFEFQRLHGMGEALYQEIVGPNKLGLACRVYAPVGSHEDLLAYLVRRLLENGANTSFVNRIVDERAPIDEIVADPISRLRRIVEKPHPGIPLPRDLFADRKNSRGIDLSNRDRLVELDHEMQQSARQEWRAAPIIGGVASASRDRPVFNPADRRQIVGYVAEADVDQVRAAAERAAKAAPGWNATPAEERARCLERAAGILESDRARILTLLVREGGRTIPDALGEVREAVDFCRYYAVRAKTDFAHPEVLPGPTGERNELSLQGRGVFACISPWNFPLSIFLGQIAAALTAGNAVLAKPAEQTPLVAAATVSILHQAGVPGDALQLLPGDGKVGAAIVADSHVAGVAFTGSTETAHAINLSLAKREGPILPFIAETGGQNAMIADSSALPEQVVADAVTSAFNSAGQRCSALRVLFLQEDIAQRIIAMLKGAMEELTIGDPALLRTDVGPVIDEDARIMLDKHARIMKREARLIAELPLPQGTEQGTFFAPRAFEIDGLQRLKGEVFGPILHVVRWSGDRLSSILDQIEATGYGLTLGVHSRIDDTIETVRRRLRVGNLYVNRTIIGAVVGAQPFGGEGLSGTGPKAGGPHYLHRFAVERSVSIDTTAAGGNAGLLSLQEEAG